MRTDEWTLDELPGNDRDRVGGEVTLGVKYWGALTKSCLIRDIVVCILVRVFIYLQDNRAGIRTFLVPAVSVFGT